MKKWEIWLAKVVFEDNLSIIKERPVLIFDDKTACVLSFKMTSHIPRKNYSGEYQLKYYKEAGLLKATTVRLSKLLSLKESDFICKIGRVHPFDINEINKILRSM